VDASSLKLSVSISAWNFSAPSNTLRLRSVLSFSLGVSSVSSSEEEANATVVLPSDFPPDNGTAIRQVPLTVFTVSSERDAEGASMTARIVLVGFGRADSTVNLPVNFSLSVSEASASDLDLVVDLPHFVRSFRYDPDFSVALSRTDDEGADNADPTDILPLVALVSLVALPVVLVLAASSVAVLLWVRRRNILRETRDAGGETVNVNEADLSSSSFNSSSSSSDASIEV